MKKEDKDNRSADVENVLNELVASGESHEDVVSQMAEMGVYILEVPEEATAVFTAASSGADVKIDFLFSRKALTPSFLSFVCNNNV